MTLTAAAGLPQLVTRGSNADEGMRELWAMGCAQARRKHRGKLLAHRVVIKDGDDDNCAFVGYDDLIIADLCKRILIKSPKASAAAGESSAAPSTVPSTSVSAEGAAASPLGGLDAGSSAAGDGQGSTPASAPPPVTLGGAGVEPPRRDSLDLFSLSFTGRLNLL